MAATAKTGEATAQVAELQIAVERAERSKAYAEARTATLQDEVADTMTKAARLERKVSNIRFRIFDCNGLFNPLLSSYYLTLTFLYNS